ncbi:MAG TPA: hypothetical protein VNQ76_10295 [Planctomicrobium sp.]|nr:hypothetical protein [Planctomicrobium sp.]
MRNRKIFCLFGAALLLFVSSSCMMTPEEKIIGRWYSGGMSIRFRKDKSVLYNTAAGRAVGYYYFDPVVKNLAREQTVPNLVLDVVRNNQRVRVNFELEIMANDRIRLTYLPGPDAPPSNRSPRASILKRADDAPVTPVVAGVPSSR